jgi:hypothetical protein
MRTGRLLLLSYVLAAVMCAACGGYGSYCDEVMNCMGGNDADLEACEINLDASEEVASIENCSEEFDAWFTCLEEESECRDENWTAEERCDDENEKLQGCLE